MVPVPTVLKDFFILQKIKALIDWCYYHMRAFHLEMLHFGEIHTMRYIILRPIGQITVSFWPFGFDLANRSGISAFKKCYGSGCFDQLIVHGIN